MHVGRLRVELCGPLRLLEGAQCPPRRLPVLTCASTWEPRRGFLPAGVCTSSGWFPHLPDRDTLHPGAGGGRGALAWSPELRDQVMHLGPVLRRSLGRTGCVLIVKRAEPRCLGTRTRPHRVGVPVPCAHARGSKQPWSTFFLRVRDGLAPSWWRAWSPWVPLPRREGPGDSGPPTAHALGHRTASPGWGESVRRLGGARLGRTSQRRCCAGCLDMPCRKEPAWSRVQERLRRLETARLRES